MKERRRHPRHKVRTSVKYRRLDDPVFPWHENPHIENISEGGMLFHAYEPIPASTMLLFKLQITRGEDLREIIQVRGEVIGMEEGIVSHPTRVAFVDLDNAAKVGLKEFMHFLHF